MSAYHHHLAEMCSKAYEARGDLVLTYKETDILFEYQGDTCILAVRGTEASTAWPLEWSWEGVCNLWDIARDLQFVPWRDPISGGWMHKGFGTGAYDWFLRFKGRLPKEGVSYVITGHSLGAGIAPHLARMMTLRGYKVKEVVLFGEPAGHYWNSRNSYVSLGIPTTSYRTLRDWIQFAGVGRRTVRPTLRDPGPLSRKESHNIEVYCDVLAPVRGAATL